MKSILIGSVGSSKIMLEEMIKMDFPIEMVFSLDEQFSKDVSGYEPLHRIAEENGIPTRKFKRINDEVNIKEIIKINPDYIFVIGLSQLVSRRIIRAANMAVVGFHPAPLPKFRGRAAMVWQMLLEVKESKCTLFFIDEGIDSGNIIGQESYYLDETDYAKDVEKKLYIAFSRLIRRVLPQITEGTLKPVTQDESEATYSLKRTPEDGLINWSESVKQIQCLIRAVSSPYPGAYALYDGIEKVVFLRADYVENKKYIGLNGQIADINSEFMEIVCSDGLLRVYEYEMMDSAKLSVGHKFK